MWLQAQNCPQNMHGGPHEPIPNDEKIYTKSKFNNE